MLDAVYYLCYTKSYFSAYQQPIAQHGKDGFSIKGLFAGRGNDETIVCKWQAGKKEIFANGAPYEKVNDHIGRYAAVMIAPDDVALINEGNEIRRRWLDGILSQSDKRYFELLLQYQNVLLQRNAWLKMYVAKPLRSSADLDFYNEKLAVAGAYIFEKRKEFILNFINLVVHYHHQLSSGREEVHIAYKSQLQVHAMDALLKSSLEQDMRLQRTTCGIHKDGLEFLLDGRSLRQYGSQGQKKTFLFALKLAQYAFLKDISAHAPILLLDDVFEKLDDVRLDALLKLINTGFFGQVLITDTHPQRAVGLIGKDILPQALRL